MSLPSTVSAATPPPGHALCQFTIDRDHSRIGRLVLTNCDAVDTAKLMSAMRPQDLLDVSNRFETSPGRDRRCLTVSVGGTSTQELVALG